MSPQSIDVLNEEVVVALRQKYPDICQVNLTKNVTSRGINYRNGMMIVMIQLLECLNLQRFYKCV